MSTPIAHPLLCHPAAPCPPALRVSASGSLTADGALALRYEVLGDVNTLLIPAPQPPGAADGLWQHTCCEAFVAGADGMEYREFNFSPSGQWAIYRFPTYRERDACYQPSVAPTIGLQRRPDGFRLDALVARDLLPAASQFNIGLTAVIEAAAGGKSYWALAHCAAQPDFHLRQSFVLTLDLSMCCP